MHRIRLSLAALLLLPSLAAAQKRGMGGSKDTDWNSVASKAAPAGPTISSKDFEDVSVFKLFLDKKKDLKLTDAQMVAMKEADAKLKAANADRFKLLDSLKKDARPRTSGTPAAEDEARMVLAREALNGVVADIRGSFDAAAKDAAAALDDAQMPTAESLMPKYREEMQDMLRAKMGGRAGGGGGAPGRGGRGPG